MFHACCLHTFKLPEPPCLQICLLQIPIKSGMHLNEGLHQTYQLLLPSANGVIAWQGCPVASTCSLYSPLLFSFVCLRPPFRIYTNSSCLLPAHFQMGRATLPPKLLLADSNKICYSSQWGLHQTYQLLLPSASCSLGWQRCL